MNLLILMLVLFANFFVAKSYQTCGGKVCTPDEYDMFEMPEDHIQVDIGIRVVEVLEIDDHDFSAAFYMYFSVTWNDSRLINKAVSGKTVKLETTFLGSLWVPDIYIYNLKSFYNSRVLTDFAGLLVEKD